MKTKILSLFITWRALLFVVAILSTFFVTNFGGRFPYSENVLIPTNLPSWIWGFGNFDGVHYIRIARTDYRSEYTQAFFPVYPRLIGLITPEKGSFANKQDPSSPFYDYSKDSLNYFLVGFLISNFAFIFSLFVLFKLFKLDFSEGVSLRSTILLLSFPTTFYFGALYAESLFILAVVLALYFMRKRNFLLSGVFCCLASATKLFGVFLLPVLLIELYFALKERKIILMSRSGFVSVLGILLAPLGFVLYSLYLNNQFGDALLFLNAQPAFGAERSVDKIILLPQVIFRYIKMLFSVPVISLSFFNALLELMFTIVPLALAFLLVKKIRISYWFFVIISLVVPTLTGTLSSMPRYALMSFILFPQLVILTGKYYKIVVGLLIILQGVLLSLFIRGYWIA